ncbi:MAG TPA: alpha/beta hydrolase [Minicystis sp.]|nr:alpha/beta hydrolase [Minicystis sp.]
MLVRALGAAVVVASMTVNLGCGGPGETGGVPRPEGKLTFTPCDDGFECSTLEVPIDEAHPEAGSFMLPVLRAAATRPDERIGVLLVNPGGPGGSGVELAKEAPMFFPPDVLARFDVVGLDLRGTAGSEPAIDCVDSLDAFVALDLTPDDPGEEQAIVHENRALAQGCEARSAAILPFVDTPRAARDLDRLRDALGEELVNYLGYSYGTFLGALYADEFPDRIRTMVLDGAIDPAKDGKAFIEGQAVGFETELDRFLDDQKANASGAFHMGGDPGAALDALLAALDAHPLEVKQKKGPPRTLGPGEAWYAITEALYTREAWDYLAGALAKAAAGDGADLLLLSDSSVGRSADGSYDNFYESYLAITAVDTPWPATLADDDALAAELEEKAPRLGAGMVYSSVVPLYWPVPPERAPAPIHAEGTPPIVVVGNRFDPATPYADAQALSSELADAVLLTWTGDGHTAFGGRSTCIDDAVTTYLVGLLPPRPGTVCD